MLDFEDNFMEDLEESLFELVTPGSIDRKVKILSTVWELLYRKYPDDVYVQTEYFTWKQWSDEVLGSSWWYKFWPTGIINELDEWKLRYQSAYDRVVAQHGSSTDIVKIQDDSIEDTKNIMKYILIGLGIVVVSGAGWWVYKKVYK